MGFSSKIPDFRAQGRIQPLKLNKIHTKSYLSSILKMRVIEKWFVWESAEKWIDVECYLLEDAVVIINESSVALNFAGAAVERKGVGFTIVNSDKQVMLKCSSV